MAQLDIQPRPSDNIVTLTKKFLSALNLYFGGALPGQPVNVDVSVVDGQPVATITNTVSAGTNIGGFSEVEYLTQTGASGAYLTGDVVGATPATLTPFRTGGRLSAVLQSVTVIDKNNVGPALRIFIGLPGTFATKADNTALGEGTFSEGLLAVVDVTADDYVSMGSTKVASIGGIGKVLALPPSFDVLEYAVVSAEGWTATVANGIRVNLGFLQD